MSKSFTVSCRGFGFVSATKSNLGYVGIRTVSPLSKRPYQRLLSKRNPTAEEILSAIYKSIGVPTQRAEFICELKDACKELAKEDVKKGQVGE